MTNTTKDNIEETKALLKSKQSWITYVCWAILVFALVSGIWTQSWNLVFLSAVVFGLTLIPFIFSSWSDITIPSGFMGAIVAFFVATVFLGEVGDFYEKYWWWDTVLHTGSAIGFALIGMLIVLFLLRGNRIAAPPFFLALMAFSFAMAMGGLWEIYEYAMDQWFGLNMQKDGLDDTMQDLIVDAGGAFIGALAGWLYLRTSGGSFLGATLDSFVKKNPHLFDGGKG